MKKVLAYTLAAALLGVVTMLAPFALFVGEMDMQTKWSYASTASAETERAYGIPPATYPTDILFIASTLALSLVIALGVMSYFRRKTIF